MKKKKLGLIILSVAAVIIVASLVVLMFILKSYNHNGTYELYALSSDTTYHTVSEIKERLGQDFSATITIKNRKYTLSGDAFGNENTGKGTIKIKKDKFTMDKEYSGWFEDDTLIIEKDTTRMIFKKK